MEQMNMLVEEEEIRTNGNEPQVDDEVSRDDREIVPFKYSITSYGADYPVDSIVKRLRDENIFIPSFQREYVWNTMDASRFVESLLLGLPVPGVFLSREETTQKLLVIDGQQRLKSLQFFYDGIFAPTSKEFALQGVQDRFKGKTYKNLDDEDRLRLDDSIIHATIVRQDTPTADNSSIYYIFERLNTYGRRLHPQEIRAAVYHGEFNALLGELNENPSWRLIYGKPSARLKDEELILRFLALYFDHTKYSRPMKEFLNLFMASNRQLNRHTKETLSQVFNLTIEQAVSCLGERAFRPERALNAAVFDAVMVGLAERLKQGLILDCAAVKSNYEQLLQDARFENSYIRSTANDENVRQRLDLAIEAFADVK